MTTALAVMWLSIVVAASLGSIGVKLDRIAEALERGKRDGQ